MDNNSKNWKKKAEQSLVEIAQARGNLPPDKKASLEKALADDTFVQQLNDSLLSRQSESPKRQSELKAQNPPKQDQSPPSEKTDGQEPR